MEYISKHFSGGETNTGRDKTAFHSGTMERKKVSKRIPVIIVAP